MLAMPEIHHIKHLREKKGLSLSVCVKFFSTRFKYRVFQDTLFVHFRLPCFTCSV
ncbi:hypothetical protein BF29_2231 [Heyndrickxia coagulans DSM 1 = ATCC 7050]|nr:hypothetical protein BF29_2231 [Heyndrickxia coagulans DSM 1 = ATCC 7050]